MALQAIDAHPKEGAGCATSQTNRIGLAVITFVHGSGQKIDGRSIRPKSFSAESAAERRDHTEHYSEFARQATRKTSDGR